MDITKLKLIITAHLSSIATTVIALNQETETNNPVDIEKLISDLEEDPKFVRLIDYSTATALADILRVITTCDDK